MTKTTNKAEFHYIWMDTSYRAICLKERPDHGDWNKDGHGDILKRQFGRISTPPLRQRECMGKQEFLKALNEHKGEIIVIGHADDPFVWRGDLQEFLETWEVD
jgi:hypothetical protein